MTDLGDDDKLASIADDIVVGLEASAAAVETQIRQGSDAAASESTRPVAVPMKAAMGGAGGPRMGENPKEDFKATPSYQETRKIASGSSGLCTGSSSAGAHHAGTTTSAESFGFAHPTMTASMAEKIASYVPDQVLRWYAANPMPLTDGASEYIPGATLFADISGFTPLTEALGGEDSDGQAGVAVVSEAISGLFTPLISIIQELGGDVIKFAGDALIVMFPVEQPQHRATMATLERQKAQTKDVAPSVISMSTTGSVRQGPLESDRAHESAELDDVSEVSELPSPTEVHALHVALGEAVHAAAECALRLVAFVESLHDDASTSPTSRLAAAKKLSPLGRRQRSPSNRLPAAASAAADRGMRGSILAVTSAPGSAIRTHNLRLKVGIGAGAVLGMHVGSRDVHPPRWEYFISGPAVQQVVAAEKLAKPGMVIMSPDAVETAKVLEPFSNLVLCSLEPESAAGFVRLLGCGGSRPPSFCAPVLPESKQDTPPLGALHDVAGTGKSTFENGGSIARSSFVFDRVASRLQHRRRISENPRLAHNLESYCPQVLRHALAHPWKGELRKVTVLFLKLRLVRWTGCGSRASSCDATPQQTNGSVDFDLVQRRVSTLLRVLRSFGGTLRQFVVDDKGLVLIGAFGVPPHAHEDDASRAVECSVAMIAATAASNFPAACGSRAGASSSPRRHVECSIGIATGAVFCGDVGSVSRREYGLVGDAVNLAARLMGLNRGALTAVDPTPHTVPPSAHLDLAILCDERTYRRARQLRPFTSLKPVAIKGKSESVATFSPSLATVIERDDNFEERVVLEATAHVIGRDDERMELKLAVLRLAKYAKTIRPHESSQEVWRRMHRRAIPGSRIRGGYLLHSHISSTRVPGKLPAAAAPFDAGQPRERNGASKKSRPFGRFSTRHGGRRRAASIENHGVSRCVRLRPTDRAGKQTEYNRVSSVMSLRVTSLLSAEATNPARRWQPAAAGGAGAHEPVDTSSVSEKVRQSIHRLSSALIESIVESNLSDGGSTDASDAPDTAAGAPQLPGALPHSRSSAASEQHARQKIHNHRKHELQGKQRRQRSVSGSAGSELTATPDTKRRCRTVVMSGSHGMGKSELAAEMARNARNAGMRVASTTAVATGDVTLAAWGQILWTLFGLTGCRDGADVIRRVLSLCVKLELDHHSIKMLPLLNDVLSLREKIDESTITSTMSRSTRSLHMRHLVLKLMFLLSRHWEATVEGVRPIFIVIREAQNLDQTSWELVKSASKISTVMVVLTVRRDELDDVGAEAIAALERAASTKTVELRKLKLQETENIICRTLAVLSVDPSITRAIHSRTHGVPVFVLQLVTVLINNDLVTPVNGVLYSAVRDDQLDIELPDSIQGYFTAKLDTLSVMDQLVVKVVSVFGPSVIGHLLLDVLVALDVVEQPSAAERVSASLERLVRRRFLRRTSVDDESESATVLATMQSSAVEAASRRSTHTTREPMGGASVHDLVDALFGSSRDTSPGSMSHTEKLNCCYRFVNGAFQELVYSSIPFVMLQRTHKAIATWYEASCADESELEALLPVLAFHWSRTRNSEKALTYLQAATDKAIRLHQHKEAALNIKQLLEPPTSPVLARITLTKDERAHWHGRMALVLMNTGQTTAARRECLAALALFGFAPPASWFGRQCRLKLGSVIEKFRAMRECCGGMPNARLAEITSLHGLLGQIANTMGDADMHLYALIRAVELAHRSRSQPAVATAYSAASAATKALGLPKKKALAMNRAAVELARSVGDPGLTLSVASQAAMYNIRTGDWKEAVSRLTETAKLGEHSGNTREWEHAVLRLAWISYYEGHAEEAAQLFSLVECSATSRDDTQFYARALVGTAICRIDNDMPWGALSVLSIISVVTEEPHAPDQLAATGVRALAEQAAGRQPVANMLALRVAGMIERHGGSALQFFSIIGCFAAVEVLLNALASKSYGVSPAPDDKHNFQTVDSARCSTRKTAAQTIRSATKRCIAAVADDSNGLDSLRPYAHFYASRLATLEWQPASAEMSATKARAGAESIGLGALLVRMEKDAERSPGRISPVLLSLRSDVRDSLKSGTSTPSGSRSEIVGLHGAVPLAISPTEAAARSILMHQGSLQ